MALLSGLMLVSATLTCPELVEPIVRSEPSTLLAQAQQKLCQAVSARFEATSLTLLSAVNVSDASLISSANTAIEIGPTRAGRVPVTMSWPSTKGVRQQGVLWFRINGRGTAWRLRHNVNLGHVLTVQDVEQIVVDLAALDLVREQTATSPVGLATVKAARQGEVMLSQALREPALVKRNERVRVVVGQPGLKIVTHGVALTIGWNRNDAVQIALADSEQTVLAKVAGEDEVYVEI